MSEYWYKNAIIYAVDVDRFLDSNGDGVGDFGGLLDRLDYLDDLGVTCLWLLPFYDAPDRDNGYDIKDYYDVDPELGTLDDFITFVQKAGERGIRIIIDLVMNHTSDQHPWFKAARRDPDSRYHAYYTWAENPPPVPPEGGSIFPDEEPSVWTYDEVAGKYYYHRFYHFQPGLNFANPDVREEVEQVLDFWLSFGISGFRIDAASHMIATEGPEGSQPADPHGILKNLRTFVTDRQNDAVLLGEVDVEPEKLVAYFGDGDELTLLFNFALNNFLYLALARGEAEPIIRVMRQLPSLPETSQWANFLRNLDEVDLERLSDAERQEVYEAFAPKEEMRIFDRGIRRRLAPMLGGDRARLELAFSLLFSLPGAPVLVYGDEIGMGEDLSQKGRRAVRSPMQWSGKKNGGFSSAAKSKLVLPVISDGAFSYENVNVAAQKADPDSLLNWVKKVIYTRRETPEFGYGNWHIFDPGTPGVLAHRCTWKDGIVIAVHNLTDSTQQAALELTGQQGRRLRDLLHDGEKETLRENVYEVELEPYGYRWVRIEGERDGHA